MKKLIAVLLAAVVMLMPAAGFAQPQLNSNVATVSLSMSVTESISVTATPANLTFTYNGGTGTATASGPISTTITVNVASTRTNVGEFVYFSSTNALSAGSANIPSSEVYAQINSGSVDPCTGTNVFATGSACDNVGMWNISSSSGQFASTNSVTLSMANLGSLPAGTFTGVLNFEAQAN